MDAYREYQIRCRSCNMQIAAFAETYEDILKSGFTIEDTLNTMSYFDPCCREAFMNPVYVTFNMENRDVIEGFKSVDAVEDPLPISTHESHSLFMNCINSDTAVPIGEEYYTTKNIENLKQTDIRIGQPRVQSTITPTKSVIAPIDMGTIGQGITIDLPVSDPTKFIEPKRAGVPTINHDLKYKEQMVNVGAGKSCKILNGRTYLAR